MADVSTIKYGGPQPLRAPMFRDGMGQLKIAGVLAVLFYAAEAAFTFYAVSLLNQLRAALEARDAKTVEELAQYMVAVSRYEFLDYVLVIAGAALFFTAMYGPRKAMMGLGRGDWEYSYGWTVGTIVIPFVNFYRPWVGLGEIDRIVSNVARTGQIAAPAAGLSIATLVLGIVFMVGSMAVRALGKIADRLPEPQTPAQAIDSITQISGYVLAGGLIIGAITLTMAFYLARQLLNLRQIARTLNVM